ncbi:MAG: hypothetical protein E6R08_00505 [Nevskiaceae bacterium]|nr:MAG: hypothetical protein E6R08_00505 [Nevskiaceae bacterium]
MFRKLLTSINAIRDVRRILGFVGGGVHKRIDENRELLETLQREAPDFLEKHSWVEGWLSSNDEFFVELASSVPITEGLFLGQSQRRPDEFPRPWPGAALKSPTR